jgi:hypothetical protein
MVLQGVNIIKYEHRLLKEAEESMQTKAVVISDNQELYGSLKRALKAFANVTCDRLGKETKFEEQPLKDRHVVVLLDAIDLGEIRRWRNTLKVNKCCNPFVAVTCTRLPASEFDNDQNHCYLKVPFELQHLTSKIAELQPIPSLKELYTCIINWLGYNSHDIQDMVLSVRDGRRKAIELIEEIVPNFNPSEGIREQAEEVLAMLNSEAYSGYDVAEAISMLFDTLKNNITEARSVNEVLVIDDELDPASDLGRDIVSLVERDLGWKAVFVKDPEKALTAISENTKFVFLDIKFEGAPSKIVKTLEQQIKQKGIPYAILSNFDFSKKGPDLSEPKNILKGMSEKISYVIQSNSINRGQRAELLKLRSEVDEILDEIVGYEKGEKVKREIMEVLKDKKGLDVHYVKELNEIRQFIDSQALPEKFEIYPSKFYIAPTIIKREFSRKRDYIKNLIKGATSPFTKSCTLQLFHETMTCIIESERKDPLGTFSFSNENERETKAWNMLVKCIEKYPAPVEFPHEDGDPYPTTYANIINSKAKQETNGNILRLVERVGKFKYKLLEEINIRQDDFSLVTEKKRSTYVTRTELDISLKKMETKLCSKIEQMENLMQEMVKKLRKQ